MVVCCGRRLRKRPAAHVSLAGDEPQRYIVRGGVGWWVRATSPPGFRHSRESPWPREGRIRRGKWWYAGRCNLRERAVRPKLGTSPSATIPSPHPSGFRPRIGVRGMLLIAGIAMALRRPHKRMKVGRWVGFFHRLVVLPLPTPPGFRPRIGVRGMPSIAGMTNGGAGMTNGGPD